MQKFNIIFLLILIEFEDIKNIRASTVNPKISKLNDFTILNDFIILTQRKILKNTLK